jgi:hypothetical protein
MEKKQYNYNFCSQNFTVLWLMHGRLKNINLSNNLINLKNKLFYETSIKNDFASSLNHNNLFFFDSSVAFFLEKQTIVEEFIEIENKKFKNNFSTLIYNNFLTFDVNKNLSGFSTAVVDYENQFFLNNTTTNFDFYFEYLYKHSVKFLFYFIIPYIFYSFFEFFLLFLILYKIFDWGIILNIENFGLLNLYIDKFFFFFPVFSVSENFLLFIIFLYFSTFLFWFLFVIYPVLRHFFFLSSVGRFSTGGIDSIYDEDNLWSLNSDKELSGFEFSLITTPFYFFYLNLATIYFGFYFYFLNEIYVYIFDLFFISLKIIDLLLSALNLKSVITLNYSHFYFLNLFLVVLFVFIFSFFLFFVSRILAHYRLNKRKYGVDDLYKIILTKPISILKIISQNILSKSYFLAPREVWVQTSLVNLNYVYLNFIITFISVVVKFLLLIFISYVFVSLFFSLFEINNFVNCIILIFTKISNNNINSIFSDFFSILFSFLSWLKILILNKITIIYDFFCLNIDINLYLLKYLFLFFTLLFDIIYNYYLLVFKILTLLFNFLKWFVIFLFALYAFYLNFCMGLISQINIYFYLLWSNFFDFNYFLNFKFELNFKNNFIIFIKSVYGIISSFLFSFFQKLDYYYFYTFKYFYFIFFVIAFIFLSLYFLKIFFLFTFEYNFLKWLKLRKFYKLSLINLFNFDPSYVPINKFEINKDAVKQKKLSRLNIFKFKHFMRYLSYKNYKIISLKFKENLNIQKINIYIYFKLLLLTLPNTFFYKIKRKFYNLTKNFIFVFNIRQLYFYLFEKSERINFLVKDDKAYKELIYYKKLYGENSDLFNNDDHKMPIIVFLNNEYSFICVIIYIIYEEN